MTYQVAPATLDLLIEGLSVREPVSTLRMDYICEALKELRERRRSIPCAHVRCNICNPDSADANNG